MLSRKYRGAIKTFRVLSRNLFRLKRVPSSRRKSSACVTTIISLTARQRLGSKRAQHIRLGNFKTFGISSGFVRILTIADENSPVQPFFTDLARSAVLPLKSYTSSKVSLITTHPCEL